MSARFHVVFAGPLVTVQDGGRPGMMRFGVPRSGAMDRVALAAANLALGNAIGAAAIEISPGGLTLDCTEGAGTVAITGGGFVIERRAAAQAGAGKQAAGLRAGSWQRLDLRAGDRLVIRPGTWGNWCYLAFPGGIDAPDWLGSRSTHSLSGLGGGRITTGQDLHAPGAGLRAGEPIPCPVWARARHRVDVVPGPQDRFFAPGAMADFLGPGWKVTPAFDRMGLRLAGPAIAPAAPLDMPSEPILRGSVQVAGDGVATVLMADHQSTGGYPKIATVIDPDLDGLAQLRPGEALAFHAVTPDTAIARARLHAQRVDRWLAAITAASGG